MSCVWLPGEVWSSKKKKETPGGNPQISFFLQIWKDDILQNVSLLQFAHWWQTKYNGYSQKKNKPLLWQLVSCNGIKIFINNQKIFAFSMFYVLLYPTSIIKIIQCKNVINVNGQAFNGNNTFWEQLTLSVVNSLRSFLSNLWESVHQGYEAKRKIELALKNWAGKARHSMSQCVLLETQ